MWSKKQRQLVETESLPPESDRPSDSRSTRFERVISTVKTYWEFFNVALNRHRNWDGRLSFRWNGNKKKCPTFGSTVPPGSPIRLLERSHGAVCFCPYPDA